jgi:isopenicillin-N epimerase
MNRRSLIQLATAAAAAFQDNAIERLKAAASGTEGKTPEEVAKDEDYWAEVRGAFSIDRNIVNFNNGYCSPAPRVVQDAMRRYL